MIEARGVWRSFDGKEAVRGLDLAIAPGEVYGFLGPNGAGKTTTLRMLAGLLEPSRGTIAIDGRSYREHGRALRRSIGFVPDTPPLFDYLTGRQYVDLVASLYGIDRGRRDERSAALFAALDLGDAAGRLCKGLSYGMRKKVHLAAVLVTAPAVLLLDEPTTGLDPRSARALKDLVVDCRRSGTTVLLSTHVLETVEELSDRIGILDHGRLQAEGTIAELRAQRGDGSLEEIFLRLTVAPTRSAP